MKVYPVAREDGRYVQRKIPNGADVGGFGPPWTTDFNHTGWTFLTSWFARTPMNRGVWFRDEHESSGKYVLGTARQFNYKGA